MITRLLTVAVVALGAVLPAQQPPPQPLIQNGRVETKAATSIDREIAAVGTSPDPVWLAWRQPMVDGDRNLCSTWFTDRSAYVRGDALEGLESGMNAPRFPAPTGPVPLEGGTGLVVLLRVVDGAVERIRTVSDDCPLDAGGRVFRWLTGVTSTESLRYLDSLLHRDRTVPLNRQQNYSDQVFSAIGLHRDPAADTILDRLATSDPDSDVRRRAGNSLAQFRGAHGFETLKSLVNTEKDAATRRSFVVSLGQTRQPGTADILLTLAQKDPDSRVRAEAAYYYPQRAGASGISATTAIIEKDPDDNVKRRALSGLGRLPDDQSVPLLINMAKAPNTNPVVRKQAVQILGQSKDPRAVAFLETLVK